MGFTVKVRFISTELEPTLEVDPNQRTLIMKGVLAGTRIALERRRCMHTNRCLVVQGCLMIWLSLIVFMGHVGEVRGESSFRPAASFDDSVAVAPEMTASDPRTLIVNFGDPNEVAQVVPPDDQAFDFLAIGEGSVESAPSPAAPSSSPISEAPDPSSAAIPEPSSLALLSLGLLVVISGLWRTRRHRESQSA
jgi:hypothetical protein